VHTDFGEYLLPNGAAALTVSSSFYQSKNLSFAK